MKRLLAGIFLLLGAGALAQTQVTIAADMPVELYPGSTATASIQLKVHDAALAAENGVWFLNVVEPLSGGEVRQVSQLLFAAAREDAPVFRRVFTAAELEAGLSASVEFEVRRNAPAGDYLIALQLFRGTNTDPNRTVTADRLAMEFVSFRVVR